MRTFSKAYGLAAFRVGWGAASSDIIEKITESDNHLMLTYSVYI